MVFGPLTDSIINKCMTEIKKEENKKKFIKNIVEPLLSDLRYRCLPYFIIINMVMGLIVILLIILILLQFYKNKIINL